MKRYYNLFLKGLKSPKMVIKWTKALLIGTLYIGYYRMFRRNVTIRFPFFVYYKVRIVGPGRVHIDRHCSVVSNAIEGLTIVTLSRSAEVRIGENCWVGGSTIRCHKRIEIGANTITSNCLIQDSLFVSSRTTGSRHSNEIAPKSVFIGKNAWIGGYSCILAGSVIQDDCVVGFHAVCYNKRIDRYSLAMGNPVNRALPIPFVAGLQKA